MLSNIIRLIPRYGQRLHGKEGEFAYVRKSSKAVLLSLVAAEWFFLRYPAIALHQFSTPKIPVLAGELLECDLQTGDPQERHCSERGWALFSDPALKLSLKS
jgi:hypothetical protein